MMIEKMLCIAEGNIDIVFVQHMGCVIARFHVFL